MDRAHFRIVAATIAGGFCLASAASAQARINQVHCYSVSDAQLARDLQNGFMKTIVIDGKRIPYTHKSHNDPAPGTEIVHYCFGKGEPEVTVIFNRPSYLGFMEQCGTPVARANVLSEQTTSKQSAAAVGAAFTPAQRAETKMRPQSGSESGSPRHGPV